MQFRGYFFFAVWMMVLQNAYPVEFIAHRGNSSMRPENTKASFEHAVELGADFIELDVHLTKDGVPVVIHDENLKRVTNSKSDQKVGDLTFDELSQFEVGSWFAMAYIDEKIPTLEEVLLSMRGKAGVMIEMKPSPKREGEMALAVAGVLEKVDPEGKERFWAASFSSEILQKVKRMRPKMSVISIVDNEKALWRHLGKVFPNIIAFSNAYFKKVKWDVIEQLRVSGTKIWVWVVNDPKDAEHFLAKGAEGLISDGFTKLIKTEDGAVLAPE